MHNRLRVTLGLILGTVFSMSAMAQTAQSSPKSQEQKKPSVSTAATPLPAKTLVDQAVKTANADKKVVLVYFGASWCSWCHKLDRTLHSPEIGPTIATYYVLVPLDGMESGLGGNPAMANPGTDSVGAAMGLKGGPPMFAFLDGKGQKIGSSITSEGHNIGYPGTAEELKAFDALLQKTAPQMTVADRTKIMDYFTNSLKTPH